MGTSDKSGKAPGKPKPQEAVATRARVSDRADEELAVEQAGDTRTDAEETLREQKLDDIRRKIDNGFYDRDDVRKMIAERLGADLRGRRE